MGGDIGLMVHLNVVKSTDIKIFRDGLIHYLEDGERFEDDKGYSGENEKCKTPHSFVDKDHINFSEKVRSRHETMNKRFKQWCSLHKIFSLSYK